MSCERCASPNKVKSNVDENFSLLVFAAANGKPIMCCIIFAGVIQNPQIETGIEFAKTMLGHKSVPRFFENFGDEKAFPGGLACAFRGKEAPCFIL